MSDDSEARHGRIRERAYALWDADGRREGATEEYWHRARAELDQEERSGSLDDQLADTFPASDPPSLTDPSAGTMALPAAPEDEPAPALSATLEEQPTEPVKAKPSPKPRAPRTRKKLA
ncbi:MAG: hypothetical protein JWP20_2031 [Roseomonas sp.]|nr:hypothetical protein [Roseomonas sp.]